MILLQNATARIRLAAFLAILMFPVASAAPLVDLAEEVRLANGEVYESPIEMLHVRNEDLRLQLDSLEITAAHVSVEEWERRELVLGAGANGGDALLRAPTETGPSSNTYNLGQSELALADVEALFTINAFSATPFNIVAQSETLLARSIENPRMNHAGIDRQDEGGSSAAPSGAYFANPSVAGERTFVRAEGENTLTLTGNIVLEMVGPTLAVNASNMQTIIYSGHDDQPVAGNENAVERTTHFVRLTLTGATVTVATSGGTDSLEWVQPHVVVDGGGEVRADGTRLAPAEAYTILPFEGRLKITEQEVPTAATALAADSDLLLTLGAASIAILSLGCSVWLALRFGRRTPTMDDVEEAMEAGAYRKAAKLSQRIVARRPRMDDARLSRAIALSRRGAHSTVVSELENFLKAHRPKDGTFHYVLGLSLLDLGRKKEAANYLREAARITPDLAPEVEARIGAPVAPPMDVNGYA